MVVKSGTTVGDFGASVALLGVLCHKSLTSTCVYVGCLAHPSRLLLLQEIMLTPKSTTESSNTRDRLCDRVSPSQIDTTGFTHLYFAFAEIDPKTYGVISVNGGDADRYEEFTKLQSSSLETWIAIGGFDFSDPGSTRHTWSDLSSTQGSRAAFITSLQGFMSKYSFQGVDIDWEYPATPERGGMRAE